MPISTVLVGLWPYCNLEHKRIFWRTLCTNSGLIWVDSWEVTLIIQFSNINKFSSSFWETYGWISPVFKACLRYLVLYVFIVKQFINSYWKTDLFFYINQEQFRSDLMFEYWKPPMKRKWSRFWIENIEVIGEVCLAIGIRYMQWREILQLV